LREGFWRVRDQAQTRAFGYVYGAAHLGKSLTWYFSELLFAYFLTEFCGLAAQTMGLVLAASYLFSAVVDPVVGRTLGRLARSVGRASRLQALGALVSGVALLLFSATGLAPAPLRFGYALTASCAFRLAYAFYDVPQNAILSLAAGTPEGRMGLSAIRIAGSGVATLVVALTAANLIGSAPQVGAGQFLWVSLVFAGLGGLSAVALAIGAGDLDSPSPGAAADREAPRSAGRPADLWRLTAIGAVIAAVACAQGLFIRLEPYFTRAVLTDKGTRMIVLAVMALGGATSQPLWMWGARWRSFPAALAASASTLVVGTLAFVLAAGGNTAVLAVGGLLFGAGASGLGMLLWSVFAEVIASGRGHRFMPDPGFAFAILTAAIKVAAAASILVVSHILAGLDYHSAKVATSWSLLAPMAAGPIIGAGVCLLAGPYLGARNGKGQRAGAAPPQRKPGRKPAALTRVV
jgi:Na+/melibiose symporter-like transporter